MKNLILFSFLIMKRLLKYRAIFRMTVVRGKTVYTLLKKKFYKQTPRNVFLQM